MADRIQESSRSEIIRIVAAYSLFGMLWIYLSDSFLGFVIRDPAVMSRLSMYKGLMFIALTAVLLYVLIARYIRRISRYIADLNQAEEAFRTLAMRQNAILEAVPDIIMEADTNAVYTWSNNAGLDFFGEDVVGKKYESYFEREQNTAEIVRPLYDGTVKVLYVESWQRRKDGEVRLLAWWCKALEGADGTITGTLSTARDITESKRDAEKLQESESRLQLATRAATIGIWDWDVVSKVLSWDDSMYALYGLRKEDFSGAYDAWTCTLHPEDRLSVEAEIQAALRGEREYAPEFRIIRPDGTVRFIKAESRTFFDSAGTPLRMIGTNTDITERKKFERELQNKNTELEHFAYTVSHDLKSPLITIRSFCGSLRNDLVAGRHDRLERDLLRIDTAAEKMTSLLNVLLELSRVGHIINTPVPTDMTQLVEDVLAHLSGSLQARGVNVSVQPGLPAVLCDRQRMAEAVQNLVENAVKYMGDQADPRIVIGARSDAGETVFFVQDNGIGIDEKYQQHVFSLFNKLDLSSEGTGIGLALVRRIIEVHGGRIWVESAGVGKGSCFCFAMPEK